MLGYCIEPSNEKIPNPTNMLPDNKLINFNDNPFKRWWSIFETNNVNDNHQINDPKITPNPPSANFDTYVGKGTGRYNGVAGATAEWTFTDAGEPGKNDTAKIVIKDVNNVVVLTVSGNLKVGNQQAHNQ